MAAVANMKYRVRIKSKNRKDALAEGAERLGVDPSKVIILEEVNENYLVSIIDAPGEYDFIPKASLNH